MNNQNNSTITDLIKIVLLYMTLNFKANFRVKDIS